MVKTELIVLASLVILGIVGAIFVLQAETTAQLTYTVYERPPVLARSLTTEKCDTVSIDNTLSISDCQNKLVWDCHSKYPISPGGAVNVCADVCIKRAVDQCRE